MLVSDNMLDYDESASGVGDDMFDIKVMSTEEDQLEFSNMSDPMVIGNEVQDVYRHLNEIIYNV